MRSYISEEVHVRLTDLTQYTDELSSVIHIYITHTPKSYTWQILEKSVRVSELNQHLITDINNCSQAFILQVIVLGSVTVLLKCTSSVEMLPFLPFPVATLGKQHNVSYT